MVAETEENVAEVMKTTSKNPWVERFQEAPVNEIYSHLKSLKAYEVDPEYNKKRKTSEFEELITGFVDFILTPSLLNKGRIKELTGRFFTYADIYAAVLTLLARKVQMVTAQEQNVNVYNFLSLIPLPSQKMYTLFERNEELVDVATKNLKNQFERTWLKFLGKQQVGELPTRFLKQILPYFTQTVIDECPHAPLFADFLFGVFNRGDIYAVWSLGGIFKLMVNHNFEYPDFYQAVYRMTTPQLCYATYREEFFELLSLFLSSSHIPMYIAAAFTKKLARLLLVGKLSCQEPIMSLIRNVLVRHQNVRMLLDREEPSKLDADPYDENEENMQKCGACSSSLWELKTVQAHWNPDVSKRANFVDRELQAMESYVRWRSDDEYFAALLERKFGKQKAALDEEEEPQAKRSKKKFVEEDDDVVPTNFIEPDGSLFADSMAFTYSDYWSF
ncbi:hypothetical protein L596_025090 [Steinernema carpocapsae]|uniref:CCAAT-binding factor domain-containing protein n=1 Tax=Steinernema carpocapsae TaxID=34508 RepID=A0A4U5M7L6_STECR|nr:hypothetical protein L596_025090 [Steinernema carpocapsae]